MPRRIFLPTHQHIVGQVFLLSIRAVGGCRTDANDLRCCNLYSLGSENSAIELPGSDSNTRIMAADGQKPVLLTALYTSAYRS